MRRRRSWTIASAKGRDKSDEMWEGELHMDPPPSAEHQAFAVELFLVLAQIAKVLGLQPWYDPPGLFRPGVDNAWRLPDQQYARPQVASARGIEGAAALVVEIECLGVRAETVDGALRLT